MYKDMCWLVAWNLRTIFRKRSNLIFYLGLPLIGVLISLMLYSHSGETALRVGVVNADGNEPIAADTAQFLKQLGKIQISEVKEQELKDQLAAGKLDSGLVISSGFSQSVLSGHPQSLTVMSVKGAQVTASMKSMLNEYISNLVLLSKAADGDLLKFQKLYDDYKKPVLQVTSRSVNDASVKKQMTYQSIGFLIMFMMMSAVNLSELILKNREDRTFFRMISSPISSRTYVLSNIIVNFIVMVAQVVITLFFMQNVFNVDPGLPLSYLAGLMLLFSLVSVSLSLVIVAFSKNTNVSGAMQNLIVVPTCLLAGCFFPADIMPPAIRKVADFLPQHWLIQSIEQLQNGGDLSNIWFNLSVMVAFIVVFFLIATYKFGRNNDTRTFV